MLGTENLTNYSMIDLGQVQSSTHPVWATADAVRSWLH